VLRDSALERKRAGKRIRQIQREREIMITNAKDDKSNVQAEDGEEGISGNESPEQPCTILKRTRPAEKMRNKARFSRATAKKAEDKRMKQKTQPSWAHNIQATLQ
jgi:hypothetical protein